MDANKPQPGFQVTDRRFWVKDESVIEQASAPQPRYPSFVEELKARTELAERKLKERIKQLEEENEAFRARLNREMEKRLEQEKLQVFRDLLEVVDNLERALEAAQDGRSKPEERLQGLVEGVQLNLELFLARLKAAGIEPLEVLNQPFDPHESEAVGVREVQDPNLDQHVVEVVQKGFRCGDQLLRPARVRVGQFDPGQGARAALYP